VRPYPDSRNERTGHERSRIRFISQVLRLEAAHKAGISVHERAELFSAGLSFYRNAAIVEAFRYFLSWRGVSLYLKLREVFSIFGFTEPMLGRLMDHILNEAGARQDVFYALRKRLLGD